MKHTKSIIASLAFTYAAFGFGGAADAQDGSPSVGQVAEGTDDATSLQTNPDDDDSDWREVIKGLRDRRDKLEAEVAAAGDAVSDKLRDDLNEARDALETALDNLTERRRALTEKLKDAGDDVRDHIRDELDEANDALSDVRDALQERVEKLQEDLENAADDVRDQISENLSKAREALEAALDRLRD